MTVVAVLASGPSMSQAVADSVYGRCRVVAVSDTYRLAPWADALVSNDMKWWNYHKEAMHFPGRKFCSGRLAGTEHLVPLPKLGAGSNSGLQGIRVARDMLFAHKILLLGFDMHGDHFFGKHPVPLKNTSASRRQVHLRQFAQFDTRGCVIVNCTPGSSLDCFPRGDLEEELL